jgi:DNA topoisomerase-3
VSLAPKPLIIAEKPSAARAIAEALGGFTRREGYMESDEFRLSWAIGHLVELKGPEEYDPAFKRWSLTTLPILPERFELKVAPKTRAQFNLLARLVKAATEVINACDAGREGELIFRYIYSLAGGRAPVRRLWTSALTREAIRKAWREMKPAREYDRLYQSALCRAQGDWLVGMNATRAFTARWGELLSVGRVQTPTLSLLVRREEEIERFRPEAYWEVSATFRTREGALYQGLWTGPNGDRLPTAEAAEAILRKVKGQNGQVQKVEAKEEAERPPLLYDLTSLQREANRRFGLTAAATLKAAQSLYEGKHITYPRTDSRFITKDLLRAFPRVLAALESDPLYTGVAKGANLDLVGPGNRRVVDESKVTDHHAILPTAEVPRGLSGVEAKIYDLIALRFLAQFYPEARWAIAEAITGVEGELFRSRGKQLVQPGWRQVEGAPGPSAGASPRARKGLDEGEQDGPPLPPLQAGERVAVAEAKSARKETQPPKRYSEATLLAAMEGVGKELDDEALKAAMKGRGLGTPATRAAIIERLKEVGYIEVRQKSLHPTPKARRLLRLAEAAGAEALLSAELTGEWEKRIADIQAGSYPPDRLMAEIRQLTVGIVEGVKRATTPADLPAGGETNHGEAEESSRPRRIENGTQGTDPAVEADAAAEAALPAGPCPTCGRPVLKQGRDWRCSGGCELRIPTWLCGRPIDRDLAEQLLTKGKSKLIPNFSSPRTGTTFKAYLVLQDGKVAFEFPPDRPRKAPGGKRSGAKRERATAAKTGSRPASTSRVRSTSGVGLGRRSSRASEPAGGGA